MTDSITPSSLNEQTKVANLDEAKEAIQSIEAQLLELKSCIRSIEAVDTPPQFTPEQLRALCRKFFKLGAEAQREEVRGRDIEPYVYLDGFGDGLRWNFEGEVNIDADTWLEEVEFNDVSMDDDEIDAYIKEETDKTQVGQ